MCDAGCPPPPGCSRRRGFGQGRGRVGPWRQEGDARGSHSGAAAQRCNEHTRAQLSPAACTRQHLSRSHDPNQEAKRKTSVPAPLPSARPRF